MWCVKQQISNSHCVHATSVAASWRASDEFKTKGTRPQIQDTVAALDGKIKETQRCPAVWCFDVVNDRGRWWRRSAIFQVPCCHICFFFLLWVSFICVLANSLIAVTLAATAISDMLRAHELEFGHTPTCRTISNTRTLSQNQSVRPGISHSSVRCLFPLLWLRLLRTDRPDTEPSHRDAEQWWRMNTCKRQSKCSFIIANSIWEMDVCPPDARVSPALHPSFNLSCRGCKCDANVDRSRMVRSAETWRNYLASVLIFVTSQLADVTEDGISNRCPCWYAKGRKGFSSAPSLFSLTPLFFFDVFSVNSSCLPFLSCVQGVVAAEKSRGGQLLEEPKMLPFRANTFSLQVSIQDVPQFLWSIKPFTTCQVTMAAADKMSPYKNNTKSAKS